MENFEDLITQTGQENKQLESDKNQMDWIIYFFVVEKLQKAEEGKKGVTKDINNTRAVINNLICSLWEKGTKTIEDQKRQMVFRGREHKANQFKKKTYFKEDSIKPYKIGKI